MTDDPPPPADPPRRRGRMTSEEQSLRDIWMAEMWPVCREVPREIREIEAMKTTLRDVS